MHARIVSMRSGYGQWTDHAKRERNAVLAAYGSEYLRTALKAGSRLVRAQLAGQALELLLKVYLFGSGLDERHVRSYGHNLVRLLTAATAHGLDQHVRVTPTLRSDIAAFDAWYRPNLLRYFSLLDLLGRPEFPELRRLLRFAQQLEAHAVSSIKAA